MLPSIEEITFFLKDFLTNATTNLSPSEEREFQSEVRSLTVKLKENSTLFLVHFNSEAYTKTAQTILSAALKTAVSSVGQQMTLSAENYENLTKLQNKTEFKRLAPKKPATLKGQQATLFANTKVPAKTPAIQTKPKWEKMPEAIAEMAGRIHGLR